MTAAEVARKAKRLAWEADLHLNHIQAHEAVKEARRKLLELDRYCDQVLSNTNEPK